MSLLRKLWKKTSPDSAPAPGRAGSQSEAAEPRLSASLAHNLQRIKDKVQHASDLIVRELQVRGVSGSHTAAAVLYIDGLADKDIVHQCVMLPLLRCEAGPGLLLNQIEQQMITASGVKQQVLLKDIVASLLYSSTIVLIEGESAALIVTSEGWEHRIVSSPNAEPLVRGPQDAFNEVLRTNTALLRRKIKDEQLVLAPFKIGSRTVTDGIVIYLQDTANPRIVEEVKRRLAEVQTEGILDSGQLQEYLEDCPTSPFPQISSTERSDKAAAAILEGKVVVLIDGTPFALFMPVTFPEFLVSTEDYYGKFLAATMLRLVRALSLMLALLMPSIYIAVSTYHQEMLPTQLMIAIAANRSGLPFPAFFEALIMEVSLELLREASLRIPGSMGQTIGIVGALVIGQAAVQANIVGPVLTIIVSITAIGTFVIPNYNASVSIRLLRYPIMIFAAVLGIFGIVFCTSLILMHMIHLRSFGVSYLAPITPQTMKIMDDSILFKKPNPLLRFRQSFLGSRSRR
ncbi:spore germination protein [Paenibacillus sp. y28]|uniref:spore germination protein n=1 Tax=Paenibacillus sp. y28 TaxID=3129110 RepID=UPI0030171990